jgi:DNA polymerase sigma
MEKFRKNTMSLGELFIAFFDYFAAFDWQDQVVQVRSSAPLWKLDKEWHRSTMSIEDPFDLSHNLVAGIRLASKFIVNFGSILICLFRFFVHFQVY